MSVLTLGEMAASWESAALVSAIGVAMGSILYGMNRILKTIRNQTEEVKSHTEREVIKANGVPTAFLDNLRFPAWYKDKSGKMKYINAAYTQAFGVRPQQYVGRTDAEVWPPDVARNFTRNDAEVLTLGVELQFHEEVPDDALNPRWFVVKFPVIDPITREVRGVGGYCLPEEMIFRAAEAKPGVWSISRGDSPMPPITRLPERSHE